MSNRMQGRVDRITERFIELTIRLKAKPDDPKAEQWRRRLEEYELSIHNIVAFGKERPSATETSVDIQVPVGVFNLGTAGD